MHSHIHAFMLLALTAALLAMGADNTAQLARCEATGRGPETCRLLVLGR